MFWEERHTIPLSILPSSSSYSCDVLTHPGVRVQKVNNNNIIVNTFSFRLYQNVNCYYHMRSLARRILEKTLRRHRGGSCRSVSQSTIIAPINEAAPALKCDMLTSALGAVLYPELGHIRRTTKAWKSEQQMPWFTQINNKLEAWMWFRRVSAEYDQGMIGRRYSLVCQHITLHCCFTASVAVLHTE